LIIDSPQIHARLMEKFRLSIGDTCASWLTDNSKINTEKGRMQGALIIVKTDLSSLWNRCGSNWKIQPVSRFHTRHASRSGQTASGDKSAWRSPLDHQVPAACRPTHQCTHRSRPECPRWRTRWPSANRRRLIRTWRRSSTAPPRTSF